MENAIVNTVSVATSTSAQGNKLVRVNNVDLSWENLQQPRVDLNGNRVFDVQLAVNTTEAAEAIQAEVPNFSLANKKFTVRRQVFAGKPRVVDAEGNALQARIGNGSVGNVIMEQRTAKSGVQFMSLVAVQVTSLVDYDAYKEVNDDFNF